MILKNKNTGEIKELSIITNGQDMSGEIFGNSEFSDYETEELLEGYPNGATAFVMSQDDYNWWAKYFDNLQEDTDKLFELAIKCGYCNSYEPKMPEVFTKIIHEVAETYDMDDYNNHHEMHQEAIKKIVKGVF